eukprot:TRINITY_DN33728_c1_g1_i1.p1 TRINITY_DN33728_c1_g1~~TRINITY_DN33728_c1_g1_i1.p1  ORF type:complete len:145 (+),score=27.48 TRINITY_DN33728_c1_g1_i1:66-500(+)
MVLSRNQQKHIFAAMPTAAKDIFLKEQAKKQQIFTLRLTELFRELDESGDGRLDWEEFETLLRTPAMAYFMKALEIETTDLESLFAILDTDQDGEITLEDFAKGAERIKGPATRIDVATILCQVNGLVSGLDSIQTSMASLHSA